MTAAELTTAALGVANLCIGYQLQLVLKTHEINNILKSGALTLTLLN